MKTIQFLICSFLFLNLACEKDNTTAPPITAENTFSCKINGELFVPKDHGSFPNSFDGTQALITDDGTWRFILSNVSIDIYIYMVDVDSTGNYELSLSDGDADFFQETENLMEVDLRQVNGSTHLSTNQSGTIEVLELDADKRIVLQFDEIMLTGINNSEETVVLTEGKLNINLETLFDED